MKLKLNPSARIKRRYLLVSGIEREEIEKVLLDYLGALGWAKASPIFVSSEKEGIIFAVSRKEVYNVRAAFEMSKRGIRVLRVSGTLKGLERKV